MTTNAMIVKVPFSHIDALTGQRVHYKKGDIIAHPARLAHVRSTEHHVHGHNMHLPEDHHAIVTAKAQVEAEKPPVKDPEPMKAIEAKPPEAPKADADKK